MTEKLGPQRAMLAVVLAGALVTYGGVSLFVAFFVLAPMAQALFRAADIPRAPDAGGHRAGHLDLHDVGAAGHAGHPERDPDALLRHHALRRAGAGRDRLGHHARLRHVVAAPRRRRGATRRRRLRRASASTTTSTQPTTRWCASAPPRRAQLRSGRDRRTAQHGAAQPPHRGRAAAARGGGGGQSADGAGGAAAHGHGFLAEARFGGITLGERRRRLGGAGGARRAPSSCWSR